MYYLLSMSDLFNLVLYPTNLDMCFKLAEIPSFLRLKKKYSIKHKNISHSCNDTLFPYINSCSKEGNEHRNA